MISVHRSIRLTAGIPAIVMCLVSPLASSNPESAEVKAAVENPFASGGERLMLAESETVKNWRKMKDEQEEEERKKKKEARQKAEEEKKMKREAKAKAAELKKQKQAGKGQPATKAAVSTPAAPTSTPAKAAAPVAAAAPAAAASQPPLVVKTFPASGTGGSNCATFNGYASHPGKSGKIWFEWGKTPSFGHATQSVAFTGEKSVNIGTCAGEFIGSKIYFRAVGQSGASLVYGETATFN
jgi:hypothetical protein